MRNFFLKALVALAILILALAPLATPPAAAQGEFLTCSDGRSFQIPENGQIFWSSHRVGSVDNYAVVFDPHQGGSNDHPSFGWWWQPCLPSGPDREAHDVAIVLQAGQYRFTGPECRAWLNEDGKSAWEDGKMIVDHENIVSFNVKATQGHEPEAWVAVKCVKSWASGFSFERLEPLPEPAGAPTPTAVICQVPEPPPGKVQWDPSTCQWQVLEAPTAIPTPTTPPVLPPPEPPVVPPTEPPGPSAWDRFWTGVGSFFGWLGGLLWTIVKIVGFVLLTLIFAIICTSPLWILALIVLGIFLLAKKLTFGNGGPGLIALALAALRIFWGPIAGAIAAVAAVIGGILSFLLPIVGWGLGICVIGPIVLFLAWLLWSRVVTPSWRAARARWASFTATRATT